MKKIRELEHKFMQTIQTKEREKRENTENRI